MKISGAGRNDANFQKPAVPGSEALVSHKLLQVNSLNVTSLRPRFSSKATTYRVKLGSSVTMSCEIINLGNYFSYCIYIDLSQYDKIYNHPRWNQLESYYYVITGSSVIVWKQTHRIISAGSRLIRKDSRMKLVRTNTGGIGLRIDQVSQDDRGQYDF